MDVDQNVGKENTAVAVTDDNDEVDSVVFTEHISLDE